MLFLHLTILPKHTIASPYNSPETCYLFTYNSLKTCYFFTLKSLLQSRIQTHKRLKTKTKQKTKQKRYLLAQKTSKLCFILINSVLLNLLCVWNASGHSFFQIFIFIFFISYNPVQTAISSPHSSCSRAAAHEISCPFNQNVAVWTETVPQKFPAFLQRCADLLTPFSEYPFLLRSAAERLRKSRIQLL